MTRGTIDRISPLPVVQGGCFIIIVPLILRSHYAVGGCGWYVAKRFPHVGSTLLFLLFLYYLLYCDFLLFHHSINLASSSLLHTLNISSFLLFSSSSISPKLLWYFTFFITLLSPFYSEKMSSSLASTFYSNGYLSLSSLSSPSPASSWSNILSVLGARVSSTFHSPVIYLGPRADPSSPPVGYVTIFWSFFCIGFRHILSWVIMELCEEIMVSSFNHPTSTICKCKTIAISTDKGSNPRGLGNYTMNCNEWNQTRTKYRYRFVINKKLDKQQVIKIEVKSMGKILEHL